VIELVNNAGVAKKPDQPATVDPAAVAHVALRPRGGWREARQWRTDRTFPPGDAMVIDVGPGSTAFVEWR
jgi:hypothetical protein